MSSKMPFADSTIGYEDAVKSEAFVTCIGFYRYYNRLYSKFK